MNTTCPQCGKPIRPGAKFCGSCGATLGQAAPKPAGGEVSPPTPPPAQAGAVSPPTPAPPQAGAISPPTPPPAQAGAVSPPTPPPVQAGAVSPPTPGGGAPPAMVPCPHCGKPVRSDARFCPSCGLGQTPAAGVPPAAGVSPAPPPPAAMPPPPVTPPGVQAVVPPARPPAAAAPAGKPKWILWLTLGVIALLLALAAAFIVWKDPFGWKAESAASETPTETEAATETAPETIAPTLTPEPATPTLVSAALTISSTVTATIEASAPISLTLAAPVTTTVEVPALPSDLIFSDAFTGTLDTNWDIWGSELMVKSNGRLELTSQQVGEAGVTGREDIDLAPGLRMLFTAGLFEKSERDVVFFDWDPKGTDREAMTSTRTIHLSIGNGEVLIQVGQTSFRFPLADIEAHRYEIRIDNWQAGQPQPLRVVVLIDDKETASLQLEIPELEGEISFSGRGWVDDVKVFVN